MHKNKNEQNVGKKIVHFSENVMVTMQDKLKRIIHREMEIKKQHYL